VLGFEFTSTPILILLRAGGSILLLPGCYRIVVGILSQLMVF